MVAFDIGLPFAEGKMSSCPSCGSGSLLLRIAREADVGEFFGQELNRTTYNLARMNMILHDVHFSKFDIKQEDTLEHPQHLDERFDVVVANPPFSAKWKGKDNPLNETDDRFSQYGALAPTSKADFRSRGGRLTADIQAVIAADFIRNLRAETLKGLNQRLKQGLYPFRAPIGYLDNGGGKPKTPDPRMPPRLKRNGWAGNKKQTAKS